MEKKLNFKQILPLLAIVFTDSMGITIMIPIIPFYVLAFDTPPVFVGLIISSYAFAQVIFAPVLGSLSDRFGRKPVLAVAQLGTVASLLLLGFAGALPLIFFARILDGLTGANLSTVQSAISDISSKEDRAHALGLVGAAFGAGFIFGPLISGLALRLAGNNYSAPAFVAAGFALTSFLLTVFVFKETLSKENRGHSETKRFGVASMVQGLRSPETAPLYILAFVVQFFFTMFTAIFALFTLNRLGFNSFDNAIFLGFFGLQLVFMQGFAVGRLVKRFGEYRLLVVSFVMTAIGFGVATFSPQQAVPWYSQTAMIAELSQQGSGAVDVSLLPPETGAGIFAFLFILIGFLPGPIGYTLQLPTINTLLTKRVDASKIGQTLGLSAAFVGTGTIIGPVLGGLLFDYISPTAPFAIVSILSIVLVALLIRFRKHIVEPEAVIEEQLTSQTTISTV